MTHLMRSFLDLLANPGWVAALLKPFHNLLGNPEWVAALALLIQAVILIIQAKILGRHAETMEEYTEIADSQARTAELIGQALDQQGKILAEQTTIMAEQFKFQQKIEEREERAKVLDLLSELDIKVNSLHMKLSSVSEYTDKVDEEVKASWTALTAHLLRCAKELQSSMHITKEERDYFMGYIQDVNKLEHSGNNFRKDIEQLKAVQSKHPDFRAKMFAAARVPKS